MAYLHLSQNTRLLVFGSLSVLLICVVLLMSGIGIADIGFNEIFRMILGEEITTTSSLIVFELRLPRLVLAALIGGGLSLIGVVYQGVFQNPMADPFIIGTSSGAALGAAFAIVFLNGAVSYMGISITTLAAFAGATCMTILTYMIARVGTKIPIFNLLLAGITINYLATALISLLMVFYRNSVESIIFWTLGSVSTASWTQVYILAVLIFVIFFVLYYFSKDLNNLLLGEDVAQTLGTDVTKTKFILLALSSLAVAVMVSMSGIIGFVGLVIPHITKLIFGINHRNTLPFAFFIGAIFMAGADTVARTLFAPAEIPLGVVTALLGAPYFLYLLKKYKKKGKR